MQPRNYYGLRLPQALRTTSAQYSYPSLDLDGTLEGSKPWLTLYRNTLRDLSLLAQANIFYMRIKRNMDPMFVRVAMSNPPRSVKMNNFIIIWDDNNNVILL